LWKLRAQAEKNADHIRMLELSGMKVQARDALLRRLLPFGGVVAFLLAAIVLAFASPAAGAVTVLGTMAGVLYAYLTGRVPAPPSQPPATPPAMPP
jgi:membrane associated rhomboid family serine protease